jgi:hypothetical protein
MSLHFQWAQVVETGNGNADEVGHPSVFAPHMWEMPQMGRPRRRALFANLASSGIRSFPHCSSLCSHLRQPPRRPIGMSEQTKANSGRPRALCRLMRQRNRTTMAPP